MKSIIMLSVVLLFGNGCAVALSKSYAGVEYKNSKGHVNGYTETPELAISAISDATVNEMNTETYREAVRAGRAYAYPGGGYNGDFGYYYGGIEPHNGNEPASVSSKQSGKFATKKELADVEEMAADSIRMHKKLKIQLEGDASASK